MPSALFTIHAQSKLFELANMVVDILVSVDGKQSSFNKWIGQDSRCKKDVPEVEATIIVRMTVILLVIGANAGRPDTQDIVIKALRPTKKVISSKSAICRPFQHIATACNGVSLAHRQ